MVIIMKTDDQKLEYKKPNLMEFDNLTEITGGVDSIPE